MRDVALDWSLMVDMALLQVRATGSVQAAANTSTPINLAMGTITTSASRFAVCALHTDWLRGRG
jgi:hypothetical protein